MKSPRYFCSILKIFLPSRQIFVKVSNIKFYKSPSIGGLVDTSGQTDGDTNMTKLTVAFRNLRERS
jgi:hypothetical protein